MPRSLHTVALAGLVTAGLCARVVQLDADGTRHEVEANSPPFSLGVVDFAPIEGPGQLVSGCSGIRSVRTGTVAVVHANSQNDVCPVEHYVFACQDRGCLGVVLEERERDEAGLVVWSLFEKKRPRSAFRVPLVALSRLDFGRFAGLVEGTNQTVTLTSDHNPWQAMFQSVWFLLYFRVFTSLWAVGNCALALAFLYRLVVGSEERASRRAAHGAVKRPRITLTRVCLAIEAFSNVLRLVLVCVDPFLSQRVLPYLAAQILISCSMPWKLTTNILMLFFWREVTKASYPMVFLDKCRIPSFILIGLLVVLDLAQSIVDGLFLTTPMLAAVWMGKAVFYVACNLLLGLLFQYEGRKLLDFLAAKDSAKQQRQSSQDAQRRQIRHLVQMSSGGMIATSAVLVLLAVRSVFGVPWGYFAVWASLLFVLQFTSSVQILLFGGVALSFRGAAEHLGRKSAAVAELVRWPRGKRSTASPRESQGNVQVDDGQDERRSTSRVRPEDGQALRPPGAHLSPPPLHVP